MTRCCWSSASEALSSGCCRRAATTAFMMNGSSVRRTSAAAASARVRQSSSSLMSTSSVVVTGTAVVAASTMALAMVRRRAVRGWSWTGPCASLSAAARRRDSRPCGASRSTSSRRTRPRGPLGVMRLRSTPRSRASLRTEGMARTLPLPAALLPGSATVGSGGNSRVLASSRPTTEAASGGVCGSSAASPASPITARTSPTRIVSPAASGSRRIVPSRGAGISTTALSVSTSTSG